MATSAQVPVGQTQRQNQRRRTTATAATASPMQAIDGNDRVATTDAIATNGLSAGTNSGSRVPANGRKKHHHGRHEKPRPAPAIARSLCEDVNPSTPPAA